MEYQVKTVRSTKEMRLAYANRISFVLRTVFT